jgi:hypothetical protein
MKWEVVTFEMTLDNCGRGYVSRAAARAAADRRGLCPTETRPLGGWPDEPGPGASATEWDDFRSRHGYSGCHH